jgi:hypothetical protein
LTVSIDSYQLLSARANELVENLRQKMKAQEDEIELLTRELQERTVQLENLQAAVLNVIECQAPANTLIGHQALKAYRDGSL